VASVQARAATTPAATTPAVVRAAVQALARVAAVGKDASQELGAAAAFEL